MMHDPTVPDEFELWPACPKCSYADNTIEYAPHRDFIWGRGKLMTVQRHGEENLECFVVTCRRCDYQWTMETKETQELRR